ncbi:MAG: hypothetical protein ACI9LM_001045 [Alteromonadaceae bacterium]|jgi:hypothetical protein
MIDRECEASQMRAQDLCNKMQNLQHALAMIEQLKGGMARRSRWSEIRTLVDALLREIPYSGFKISSPFSLVRGRVDNDNKTFKSPQEFSYCPVEYSKTYGRCHRPGSTIFYGANNLNTVLSELSPEVGDTVHIGFADVCAGMEVMCTSIGEIDHIRRFNKPLLGDHESKKVLNNFLLNCDNDKRIRTLLVDAYFSDAFSTPAHKEKDYKVTSALSDLILEANHDGIKVLDGFSYPSVTHRGGLNFAIMPESFDEKFVWSKFQTLEIINNLGFGLYATREISVSENYNQDEGIAWNL